MRFSKHLVDVAIFVVVALLVYFGGVVLLAVWPMWTMMGFGSDPVLALVVAALVVGTIWAIVYDIRSRRAGSTSQRCPRCRAMVEADYLLCPECYTTLQGSCRECRQPLKAHWAVCPYCGIAATGEPLASASVAGSEQHATGLDHQCAGGR